MIAKTIGELREMLMRIDQKCDDDLIGIQWSEPPNDSTPMIIIDGIEAIPGHWIDVLVHEQSDDETCEDCGGYVPLTDPVAETLLCQECEIDRRKQLALDALSDEDYEDLRLNNALDRN